MESIGLAVGLVGLFSSCSEAVQRINSYKTAGRDSRLLAARLEAILHRFEGWGDGVGIGKEKPSDNHHPDLDDPSTYTLAQVLLKSIEGFSTVSDEATNPRAPPPGNTSISMAEPVTPQRL